MTLTLELHDEKREAALKAKAQAQGMSAEQYAQRVLDRDLDEESAASSGEPAQPRRPLSARIREIWADMPDDVRAKLPADGASQHDHYLYGLPKRDQ